MGITAHFADSNFRQCHTVIALKEVLSHKGKEIADVFFQVIEEYNLLDKIGWITTDNHANNDKFCEELQLLINIKKIKVDIRSRHVRCLCHVINLVVNDILGVHSNSEETTELNRSRRLSGEVVMKKAKYLLSISIIL